MSANHQKKVNWVKASFIVMGVLTALSVALVIIVGTSFQRNPKVSLNEYATIVKNRKNSANSTLYEFLPDEVDSSAQKSSFYHRPGGFHGGDSIALRQQFRPEKIAKVLAELEAAGRTEISDLRLLSGERCYPQYELRRPGEEEVFEDVENLPSGFRVFIFGGSDQGILAFTAVSREKSEVVYYVYGGDH